MTDDLDAVARLRSIMHSKLERPWTTVIVPEADLAHALDALDSLRAEVERLRAEIETQAVWVRRLEELVRRAADFCSRASVCGVVAARDVWENRR